MKNLPRSLELRASDAEASVRQRINEWTRDVEALLEKVPDVSYMTIDVPSGAGVAVSSAQPSSVSIARVVTGTTTAAPGIVWAPTSGGFTVTALYGFSGDARLRLRIEVL